MEAITDPTQVEFYRALVRPMVPPESGREYEFDSGWMANHGWKVVAAESASRLASEDIPQLVSGLLEKGYERCIAVVTEAGYLQPFETGPQLLGDMPTCYSMAVEVPDFHELNRELGPFRFLLTDEIGSWAISCNECYNLFAGTEDLVEAILGEPIEQARREFLDFVSTLAKGNPNEPLLHVAKQYASG